MYACQKITIACILKLVLWQLRFSFAKSSDDWNQSRQNAKFSWILGFLCNEIITSKYRSTVKLVLMYQGHFAQTSAGQTGPKFKTVHQKVWKNNSRVLRRSGYFDKELQNICKNFPNRQVFYWKEILEKLQRFIRFEKFVSSKWQNFPTLFSYIIIEKWWQMSDFKRILRHFSI